MEKNIFKNMDNLIEKVGSANPHDLLDYLKIKQLRSYAMVPGYIGKEKNKVYVGWCVLMSESDQRFTLMHECTHAVEHIHTGAISTPHRDLALFTLDKNIATEEKDANICAAEYTIPTEDVLELTGYYNQTVREYSELKRKIDQASASATSEESLRQMYENLEDLGDAIDAYHCVYTYKEIAQMLNCRETFIDYKIEALRTRGYDIPEIELPDAHKTFGLPKR